MERYRVGIIHLSDFGYQVLAGGTQQTVSSGTTSTKISLKVKLHTGLTVIAGVAGVDDSLEQQITSVISETYEKAPEWNAEMTKVMGAENEPFLVETYYGDQWPYMPPNVVEHPGKLRRRASTGFLNE